MRAPAWLTTPAGLLLGGALYGFAIGAGKNLTYAWRSAVKFPLLLLGTAVVCNLAHVMAARFLGADLPARAVQRVNFGSFATLAILLGSLSPVVLFLGATMPPPGPRDLGGYPLFVGINMLFIAVAGALALLHQARWLRRQHALADATARRVLTCWLLLSLAVGGQLAFWLRPFFGIATLRGEPPFVLGDEPTVTGARNFYEVVWQFLTAADPGDYLRGR